MIPIKVRLTKRSRVTVAEWKKISREAWQAAGDFWHTEILPKHFEVGAFREYLYAARSRKHEARKQKKFGHRRPLVFSGSLERQVLRMRDVRSVGDTSRKGGAVFIKLSGPRYLGGRRGRGQPDFAAELGAVSRRDAQKLAGFLDRKVTALLSEDGPEQEITVASA